jgi:hypothetical protein
MAFYKAISVVCLHDVTMIPVGVEGAHQEREEPSHHHVVHRTSLPHQPSQLEIAHLRPSIYVAQPTPDSQFSAVLLSSHRYCDEPGSFQLITGKPVSLGAVET